MAEQFRVVVTDSTFPDLSVEKTVLADLPVEIVGGQCRRVAERVDFVASADAVVTPFAPMTADVIRAVEHARVIVRYAVCNVPDDCIGEVADHTLALMLALSCQVVTNCLHVRDGNWELATALDQMRTLKDQTVAKAVRRESLPNIVNRL